METTPPRLPVGNRLLLVSNRQEHGFRGSGLSTTWVLLVLKSGTRGEVDVRYRCGVPILHQGLAPWPTASNQATLTISVSMIAPYETGVYGELLGNCPGSQQFCQFYVYTAAERASF